MKLDDWMKREGLNDAEFGLLIERPAQTVHRYRKGQRIPDRDTMPRIVRATGGEVTANDFFDLERAEENANAA